MFIILTDRLVEKGDKMSLLNHTVVPVRTDKMKLALSFMHEFGFTKEEYEAKWEGGYAFFVRNDRGERIQLTLPEKQQPFIPNDAAPECDTRALPIHAPMLPWVHVAFECDVQAKGKRIIAWATRHNLQVDLANDGNKLFVSVMDVFWIDIELVPQK